MGRSPPAVVQLLFSTGKSFTVDGLREKLREFFRARGWPGTSHRGGALGLFSHRSGSLTRDRSASKP